MTSKAPEASDAEPKTEEMKNLLATRGPRKASRTDAGWPAEGQVTVRVGGVAGRGRSAQAGGARRRLIEARRMKTARAFAGNAGCARCHVMVTDLRELGRGPRPCRRDAA